MKPVSEKQRQFLNFFLFQVGWFACVGSASAGLPWIGVMVAFGVVMIHLFFSADRYGELKLAGFALLLGATFDSLVMASGWLSYPNGVVVTGLAPVWILALWVLFSTTLNQSMKWLQGKPVLASVLGFVFGPLSYVAGERLGAVELVHTLPVLAVLAFGWALAMPVLLSVAVRFGSEAPNQSFPAQTVLDSGS